MLEAGKLYGTHKKLAFCGGGKGYFILPRNTLLVFLKNDENMILCFLYHSKKIMLFRTSELNYKDCKKSFYKIKE